MDHLPETLTEGEIQALAMVVWDGVPLRKAAETLEMSHMNIQRLLRSGREKIEAAGLRIRDLMREEATIGTLDFIDETRIVAIW